MLFVENREGTEKGIEINGKNTFFDFVWVTLIQQQLNYSLKTKTDEEKWDLVIKLDCYFEIKV